MVSSQEKWENVVSSQENMGKHDVITGKSRKKWFHHVPASGETMTPLLPTSSRHEFPVFALTQISPTSSLDEFLTSTMKQLPPTSPQAQESVKKWEKWFHHVLSAR
jgi:hypothetical protein